MGLCTKASWIIGSVYLLPRDAVGIRCHTHATLARYRIPCMASDKPKM